MTETIGIISSFNVLCGNATYSEQISQSLEQRGYKIKRIAVPIELQKKNDQKIIDNIITQANSCSIVNVQMELGLYGCNPGVASKNLTKILQHIPIKSSVTCHTFHKLPNELSFYIKKHLEFLNLLKALYSGTRAYLKDWYIFNSFKRVFLQIKKRNFTVISHVDRDRKALTKYFGLDSILHPIMWPGRLVTNKVDFESSDGITIGLFGFISGHGNYNIVPYAIRYLIDNNLIPSSSRLVIYGGHHPVSPGYGGKSMFSVAKFKDFDINALNPVESFHASLAMNKIRNIDWVIGSDDNELANAISSVDVCVVPYLETGQAGSGITSQAMQFGRQVIMSDTTLASEHQKFSDSKIMVFDTYSYISLAQTILRALKSDTSPRFTKNYSFENILDIITLKES